MNIENKGCFALVLHSHLPYVLSHGRWPHGVDWLNEAAAETYLPLLTVCEKLISEGISPRFTIGLTPILCEMLASDSFREEFRSYLTQKIESARVDEEEFRRTGRKQLLQLARMWKEHFSLLEKQFLEDLHQDILARFRSLQEQGHIELITCGATHGYFPLLSEDVSIQAQVKMGVRCHERHFGRRPRGIWLPECAYRPAYRWTPPLPEGGETYDRKGVEEFLSENGLEYFIVDSHLLKGGKAIGVYLDRFEALKHLWREFEAEYQPAPENREHSPYEPHLVGNKMDKKPVSVLTRDPQTGLQVWSGDCGYPGDGSYLDFHKKHYPGGNRYWKVTARGADMADKLEYDSQQALAQVDPQAIHFADLVTETLSGYQQEKKGQGILVAPFDTELFGHWWFEGTWWLYRMRKELESRPVRCVTGSEYLQEHPARLMVSLPEGSWGEGGFHYIWLNEWNRWTWKHVYQAEKQMVQLARQYATDDRPVVQRLLKQLARELLLLQSSDWQFLISTWSARDYAELRVGVHSEFFTLLAGLLEKAGKGTELTAEEHNLLKECEQKDLVFPDIDPRWWVEVEYP